MNRIVKKNAIMQIDFALDATPRHDARRSIIRVSIRFRPIMMTTLAALFGAVPIALGFGRVARRRPVGLAVVRPHRLAVVDAEKARS
jgi:multidrug efflux pump subunit AcrB